MEYENDQRTYDDEPRGYERDRSRSPRGERRDVDNSRARSASPNDRDSRGPPPQSRETDESRNEGSNLFVTGIHPSLSEEEVTRLFEKYGEVEQCNIMRDPHTKESRGFGFVKMVTSDQADAAKEGLQGEVHQGRTLSIEKARRARPRTPTPGKYYGPPKREFNGGGRGRGGPRYGDRYGSDDRRGGGGYGRRDDYGSRSSRYDDRGYGGGGGSSSGGYGGSRRDDYGPRSVDRYASDRSYGGRDGGREERRGGGGGGYYDRPPPPATGGSGGYSDAAPREAYSGGRSYDGDYDHSSR
ncbi:RNA-binding domain-containing protein [Dothidotthia symphoricarpi CBS 119687]|uniref:RNA-binding domain-containing protein n=1 Tax=Dothidotthia symphoricarpi CBS 119687 TaxID=1392245 RepID=A0A6A6AMK4_9PLEO|nr:RNA-binding domain-containing protein [Dothidotthia symphoricarpi CBS 119687]KAF2132164.1 RNA-binding domain-containing protein [Dothidotthia symphoricarpi CBS 119687]